MIGDVMSWGVCEKRFVRKVSVDDERIKSIVRKAGQRLLRAEGTKITNDSVSFVVEDYYEVIKELLVSYLLKNGLKSQNHQCLISYFKFRNSELEREAVVIQQMSFFRNRLSYYGEDIPMEFYETHISEFKHIINIIKRLIKEDDKKNGE